MIEGGKNVGSKNVSGGILYSKKPKNGKVYNVEDVYGEQFIHDAPVERLITKYVLHATSKDKVLNRSHRGTQISGEFWLFCFNESIKLGSRRLPANLQRSKAEVSYLVFTSGIFCGKMGEPSSKQTN